MQPRLKDDPREWLKFTAVMALLPVIVATLLYRKHVVALPGLLAVVAVMATLVAVCAVRPRWFRRFYRAGMTASFHVGQAMGCMLLMLIFLLVVTPLGLLLRALGKDLLQLRRPKGTTTHWHPVKAVSPLERMF